MTPRQGPAIRGPATVEQGGTIEVEVDSGQWIGVAIPGQPPSKQPVRGGKASLTIPPTVQPGTLIQIIVFGGTPPTGITVEVVSTS